MQIFWAKIFWVKIFLAKIFLGENFVGDNFLGENFLGKNWSVVTVKGTVEIVMFLGYVSLILGISWPLSMNVSF